VDNFFNGVIDEVSFFDFAVSARDAGAVYTATVTLDGASAVRRAFIYCIKRVLVNHFPY
jgi:hypothetical protein